MRNVWMDIIDLLLYPDLKRVHVASVNVTVLEVKVREGAMLTVNLLIRDLKQEIAFVSLVLLVLTVTAVLLDTETIHIVSRVLAIWQEPLEVNVVATASARDMPPDQGVTGAKQDFLHLLQQIQKGVLSAFAMGLQIFVTLQI